MKKAKFEKIENYELSHKKGRDVYVFRCNICSAIFLDKDTEHLLEHTKKVVSIKVTPKVKLHTKNVDLKKEIKNVKNKKEKQKAGKKSGKSVKGKNNSRKR